MSGLDLLNYSAGSFGTGVFQTIPTVLLLYYSTETLGIGAATAGAVILAPKLLSIVWDPYVGELSDRSSSRWGRRRPFMVAGLVGMIGAFLLLFSAPLLPPLATVAWVGGTYLALTLAYSMFAVPYIALPPQLADDGATLARLVSARMLVVMIGILAGAALGPWLVEAGGGARDGYRVMSQVIGMTCAAVMILPILMLGDGRDLPTEARPLVAERWSLVRNMVAMLGDAEFRRLAATYLLQATAFGAFSAVVPYLVTKSFGRSTEEIGTALGIYLLATLAAIPIWSRLGARLGWRRALTVAAVVYALGVGFVCLAEAADLSWPAVLCCFALAGLPFAGLQVVPFTLLGLYVRERSAGAEARFTGVWTAIEKLGLALGPAIVALALGVVGTNDATGIFWIALLLPPLFSIASLTFNRDIA